jgi:hypothetical protein
MMSFLTYIMGFLGYRNALMDINLKGDHLRIISDKVWLKLARWFLTRRFLNDFWLIYSYETTGPI